LKLLNYFVSTIFLFLEISLVGQQWFMPVILATWEAKIRRIKAQSQPGQIVQDLISKKHHHKKGLVEWLK
jgi:hypothetical protein